jgi:hypothetical protein
MGKMIDRAMRTALEGGNMTIGFRSRVVIATILALLIALMAGSFGVMAQCDTNMAITRTSGPLIIGQAVTIKWKITAQTSSSVAFAGTLTRCVKSPPPNVSCDVLTGGVETSGDTPFEVEYLFSPSEAGTYTVTGSYEGCTTCDPQLNPCDSSTTFTVSEADTSTSLESSLNPSTIGDSVTFTATVTSDWIGGPDFAGTADFYIDVDDSGDFSGGDTMLCDGCFVSASGVATCSPSPPAVYFPSAGDYKIRATYSGDDNYNTSTSASLTQTVINAGATTTTVTSSDNTSPFPVTCESITFTATVTNGSGTPTGTVDFYADGVPIATGQGVALVDVSGDGVAQCTTSFNAADSPIAITATYNGGNYAGSNGSLSPDQTVIPSNTTTTIVGHDPDPSTLWQPYLVWGTVVESGAGNCKPTGTVTVTDGEGNGCVTDIDPVNGSWSCSINPTDPSTTAGAKTLSASYNGDSNFASSSSAPATHTYTVPGTHTEVMGADTPLIVNNTATYTVVVVDTSGGTDTTIPQGTVEVSVVPSSDGTLNIPLTGSPSGYHLPLDAAGQCTFTYTPTSGDSTPHAVTADYTSTSSHAASTGTFAQEVVRRAVDIALVLSPTIACIYEPVTLQIHVEDDTTEGVPGDLTGEPIMLDNGGQTGTFSPASPILDSSGNCTVTYTPGAHEAGTTTITATYAGSSVYTGKSTSESLVVNLRPTETWVVCSMEPLLVNETAIDCTITVKDVAGVGAPPPGGSITSLTTNLSGSSAVYNLSGPTGSTDSEWKFDYLCTALDELADFDTIKAEFTASDGIHADSAGAFGQGIKRRPTITTLSGCDDTASGVTCTATMEEDPDNDGVPVSLSGDLVLLGDPDETKCAALSGASPSCVFSADSDALVANVTVRFEPDNNVHLPSTATENVDRSDQPEFDPDDPSNGGDPSNTGSDCYDGCGDGGVNIDQMVFNLNVADVTLAAIQMGLDTAALIADVIPDPFAGGGLIVVAGFTIPISDIAAAISKGTSIAMAIARAAMSTDLDGDGLRDVIENTVTGTDHNVYDTDGDGLGDGYEVTVAGGFYGGTRRPDPNVWDSDGDGLGDGDESGYKTSYCVQDTDCDGVTDWEEVTTYSNYDSNTKGSTTARSDTRDHCEPLAQDTDGDGLNDAVEYAPGDLALGISDTTYSPYVNDNDSDGDGILDGDESTDGNATWNGTVGGTGVGSASIGTGETHLCMWDTDGDGLSDGEEEALFGRGSISVHTPFGTVTTPANDDDSDDDGLSDYEEQVVTGTDPLNWDTDGDGLSDADELIVTGGDFPNRSFYQESDPLDPDTDDDGIGDKTEYYNVTTGQYGSGVIRTSGDTTSQYGDPDTICPYVNDDDSDNDGLQDGWEIGSDGVWLVTEYGSSTSNGVGETSACNEDTDNDGLLDGEEEGLFGQGFVNVVFRGGGTSSTVPALDVDCDRDGLSDYEEVHVTMTNPLHWDTDGDGISDANELIATTAGTFPVFSATTNTDGVARTFYQESDPLDPDTDDDELLDTVEYDGTRLGDPASTYWLSNGGDPDTDCPFVNDDDSDDDGLQDGYEDKNQDGIWNNYVLGDSTSAGSGETDPCNPDRKD